jgi:multidrug efflux system outer membrane protein
MLRRHADSEGLQFTDMRYEAGTTKYLEVLTNETDYSLAERRLAQIRPNRLIALVQIYKDLGGSWQQ